MDTNNTDNNGYENEDLIVWMRTAALPNFRKLYRRISHTGTFAEKLPKGNYKIQINYGNLYNVNYQVGCGMCGMYLLDTPNYN